MRSSVVWRLLPAEAPTPGVVTPDDLAEAEHRIGAAREAWLRSRAFQRQTLAIVLGVPPGNVAFARDALGRSVLRHVPDVTFSATSSGPVVLVAVAQGARVGVDVERRRQVHDLEAMGARYLHPEELGGTTSAADPSAAFLHLWVAKEAVLKGVGTGLRVEPRDVLVAPDGTVVLPRDAVRRLVSDAPLEWHVRWLDGATVDGCVAAIAVSPRHVDVTRLDAG